MAGLSLGSPLESSHGAPTMMVLAEVGESADGRADVSGLVSDLVKADTAEGVLNTMVRINDVVDSDEEGLLENSFAKEVRGGVVTCYWSFWKFLYWVAPVNCIGRASYCRLFLVALGL